MNRVLIIAEAGVNHNGSIQIAKKLIDVAADAGADYVKFQTFKAEKLVSVNTPKAAYQKSTIGHEGSQFEMLKKLELSKDDHIELIDYCKSRNINFLSTPFDLESIDMLLDLNVSLFKIASGEITNLPLLRKIGGLDKEVIMSTGMADLEEIREALEVLMKAGMSKDKITILHCNTEYPTPMKDVNLRAMLTIEKTFNVTTGYSDHTMGIEVPIAAVAMGACCIEKHFTLDRDMDGPDHKASLEPDELRAMVEAIRKIELALGDGKKKPSESEKKNISVSRKCIVATIDIKKGEVFNEENITVKRSGTGINPMEWDKVIGGKAKKDFPKEGTIEL